MRRTRLVDEPTPTLEAGARVRTKTLMVDEDGGAEVELEQARHYPERKQSPLLVPQGGQGALIPSTDALLLRPIALVAAAPRKVDT
eukprot:scaffold23694_cov115-Phaeocystis_antarctica.AAC.1